MKMCCPYSLQIVIVEIGVTRNCMIIGFKIGFILWGCVNLLGEQELQTQTNSLTLLYVKHFQSGWKHQIHATAELDKGSMASEKQPQKNLNSKDWDYFIFSLTDVTEFP